VKANTHCPNCGAIVKGITCEYCGTQFIDIADLKMGEKAYLRLNYNGAIYTFKVIPSDATITCDTSPIYAEYGVDKKIKPSIPTMDRKLELNFYVLARINSIYGVDNKVIISVYHPNLTRNTGRTFIIDI
jgi:hypothetical protein